MKVISFAKCWGKSVTCIIGLFLLTNCRPVEPQYQKPNWLYLVQVTDQAKNVLKVDLDNDLLVAEKIIEISPPHPTGLYLSPDRNFIAVRTDPELTIYDLNNGTLSDTITEMDRPINGTTSPRLDNAVIWSPDSQFIAFLVHKNTTHNLDIMLYDVAGKDFINLTQNMYRENALSWSSDGEKIIFATDQCNYFTNCPPDQQYWGIAMMDVNTQAQKNISDGIDAYQLKGGWIYNSLCATQLSPDQSYVVYEMYCPSDILSYRDVFVDSVNFFL